MNRHDKKLLRIKPDEIIIYKKRINDKIITVHQIKIIHKAFSSKKHYVIYNNKKIGEGTKTAILDRLRQLIV